MRLTRARGTRRGPAHPRGGLALALNNNKNPVQGKGKENALGTRTPAPPSSPDEERRLFVALFIRGCDRPFNEASNIKTVNPVLTSTVIYSMKRK